MERRKIVLWAGLAVVTFGLPALLLTWLQSPDHGKRMPVVGAGALARLEGAESPPGVRYDLEIEPHESFEATHERVTQAITEWPDVIVLGLDASALAGGEEEELEGRRVMLQIIEQAENATAVPVVLGFVAPHDADPALLAAVERTNAWWRQDVCRAPGTLRLCVEAEQESDVPRVIAAAVLEAMHRHTELEASTQVGR